MTEAQFTCLIPAYNEAARISAVLRVALAHPLITRTIVIDDGSTDATFAIAHGLGASCLRTLGNLGKTRALAFGLSRVETSHVLLLDADLLGLTAADISALLAPIQSRTAAASISLRGNAPALWRWIGLDYISGERALPMDLIAPHLHRLDSLPRFGFEVFLNRLLIAARQPVAVVAWPRVASPAKSAKRGLRAGIRADIAMMADIFATISPMACLGQIIRLRQLRDSCKRATLRPPLFRSSGPITPPVCPQFPPDVSPDG